VTHPQLADLAAELRERRADALAMGGEAGVERQHSLGKLTVRERLDLLYDKGSFTEDGLFAGAVETAQSAGRRSPADGVVTGVGMVDGRPVTVIAYDFTVMAGSIGMHGERKAARARDLAVRRGTPVVYLLDSAGARVTESVGAAFAGSGDLFREISTMSGVVPQVGAVLGPCSAGTAYIPALCDFVPMVKGTSSMALAGVHLVRAATGEEVTEEEMGGSGVHTRISGVADREAADDAECLALVRDYLSYLPGRYGDPAPMRAVGDPVDRRSEELYEIVPGNPRQAYDMRRVVRAVVDEGSFFPMKPDWARSVITGFARFGGRPAGVVASQPMQLGGALGVDAADKAARFINICDSFDVPLVFLQDVPGFLVGKAVEHAGIIRPEDHCRAPQGLRRRLLRDGRAAVRGRQGGELAERGVQRDGARGGGEHSVPQAARGRARRVAADPRRAAGGARRRGAEPDRPLPVGTDGLRRRHHRPGRDPRGHRAGPRAVGRQAGAAARAKARRRTRLTGLTRLDRVVDSRLRGGEAGASVHQREEAP